MQRYIAYYRVSTTKQGADGLGMDAQRAAVRSFVGNRAEMLNEYTEVESGKDNGRPILAAAIEAATAAGAVLIIAKLDRLSRDAAFVLALQSSGVRFVCADMPEANNLTIGIMALLAQHEREMISTRTKAALAAAKANGKTLGTPANLDNAARTKGVEVRKERAANNPQWQRAAAFAKALARDNKTLRSIADDLNTAGFVTRNGRPFHPTTVSRLLAR